MKNEPKKTSGKHYDKGPAEAIAIIESVVSREQINRVQAYNIGQSLKYILRCGLKDGESVIDDLEKAENYLHRAITGHWISKNESTETSLDFGQLSEDISNA